MKMLRHSAMMRKTSTAFRTLRDAGVSGLLAKVRRKVYVWQACFSARGIKSVTLDGCTFSLKMIPNNAMKVSLLKLKYERFERHAVLQYIRPEYPVVELGACIGVVACVTNGALKNPAWHVVVEANPHVIPILQDNRDSNCCEFEILNLALSYDQPSVTFSPSTDFRGTSLRKTDNQSFQEPSVTVATTELGKIVGQRGYDRFTLICDIEGQEYELVMREPHILSRVDTLILETHARLIGDAMNREMMEKLTDLGFRAIDQDSYVVVLRQTELA
jgi:FkbM family methyltransferase